MLDRGTYSILVRPQEVQKFSLSFDGRPLLPPPR